MDEKELKTGDRSFLYSSDEKHMDRSTTTRLMNYFNTYCPVFIASYRERRTERAVTTLYGVWSKATYFQHR